jgi:hypothetical protein
MKVELIFIRHGLSCTNVIKSYNSIIHQVKRLAYTDPQLTTFGKLDIKGLVKHKILPTPNIILSSCLLRAMETAAFTFPNTKKQIFVAPFIKELGLTAGNQPDTISTQRLRFINSAGSLDRVNYKLVKQKNSTFSDGCFESNLTLFLNWLEISLPYLLTANNISISKKKIVIAIVTHSNFMKKFLPSFSKDKPYHLGSRRLLFNYSKQDLKFSDIKSHINEKPFSYRPFDEQPRTYKPGKLPIELHKPIGDLIFRGFQEPTKEMFVKFKGSKNCKHLI